MPTLGEIKKGRDIRGKEKSPYERFIWVKCRQCGGERWAKDATIANINYTGLCKSCYARANLTRLASRTGSEHPRWKGGRNKTKEGYINIRVYPDDFFYPMANKAGYVFEHRLVMAKHLHRCLLTWETIHHKNGVRDDNGIGNLELLPDSHKHDALTRMSNYIKKLEEEVKYLRKIKGRRK